MTDILATNAVKLTPKQIACLPHLIAATNIAQGCRDAGISRQCYHLWLKNPVFADVIKRAREDLVYSAIVKIRGSLNPAIDELTKLLDTTKNEFLKRLVANDIIAYNLRQKEQEDVIARLDKLEQIINGYTRR